MLKVNKPLSLRIWHWSNSLIITLLFFTVFLRKTFLSVRTNKDLLITKAHEIGLVLNDQQAKDLASAIRDQMWRWHPIIGFGAIGLLLYRLVIYFIQRKKQKNNIDLSLEMTLKDKLTKKLYLLFYLLLGVMGFTGSAMYFDDDYLHLSKSVDHLFQEIHENLMWFFIVFTIVHIVGVIIAENTNNKGIVSDMINGGL